MESKKIVVGIKQTNRAIRDKKAKMVHIAVDTEPTLIKSILDLCKENSVKFEMSVTRHEMALELGIEVPTSFVTELL